jgi:hypothetical protein
MPTIKIQRASFDRRKPWSEEIDADLYGAFAVHPTPGPFHEPDDYTLTHVPTGYAYLHATKADCEVAAAEINAGPLDWTAVATPKDLTPSHKAQGKAMREKYERPRG